MKPKARLYLDASDGQNLFGDGRYQLLKVIDEEGSLLKAAARLERGYRKAWGDIRRTEQALGRKLVITNRGGPTGGATQLTEFARRLLAGWDRFRDEVESQMETASGEHLGFLDEG